MAWKACAMSLHGCALKPYHTREHMMPIVSDPGLWEVTRYLYVNHRHPVHVANGKSQVRKALLLPFGRLQ